MLRCLATTKSSVAQLRFLSGKNTTVHKHIINALKLLLPAGIFIYLLWQVDAADYQSLWQQPKRWDRLIAAQAVSLLAVVISFLRWRMLVLAIGIPFSISEALRLGFLGFLLNFVSFGSVGGDLFKAILVARDKRDRRPEAVASVLLDRAIGLLALVTLAWFTLWMFSGATEQSKILRSIRDAAGVLALAAYVGLVVTLMGGNWVDRVLGLLKHLPVVGETVFRMTGTLRNQRKRPLVIVGMVMISLLVHSMIATTVYLVSSGLYRDCPSWQEHFMVMPPAMAAGALPLAPGGLGYQEGALAGLFEQLPELPAQFSGILVATIFRLVTLSIAGIGLLYYWSSQGREFKIVRQHS